MDRLAFSKVTVVGFGRTGRAAATELARRGASVFVSEAGSLRERERQLLSRLGIAWEEGGHTSAALACQLLVVSPGVPPAAPLLQEALARGVRVWSEVELAYRLADPDRLVAVTGTNGKSTTTALVGAMLRAGGLRPVVAGNIGRPAVRTVEQASGRPWVLEVSSYQLAFTKQFRPHVGIWLNFAPDHLLWHGSLDAYFAAKANLLRRQRPSDTAVLHPHISSRVVPVARTVDLMAQKLPSGWAENLAEHRLGNLRAAWGAATAAYPELECSPPPWKQVSRALGQPHRLEEVGEWKGIRFVNDSKATNPSATLHALRSFDEPVVLVLGGRPKREGYELLHPALCKRARACVLFGEAREMLAELLDTWGIPYMTALSPDQALALAYARAQPGDVVLLSPGCSSFDMFKDYAHRGRAFRSAFRRLRDSHGE